MRYAIMLLIGMGSLIGVLIYLMSQPPNMTDGPTHVLCIDGVEYYQMGNHHGRTIFPHMKQDGTVYTCEGE